MSAATRARNRRGPRVISAPPKRTCETRTSLSEMDTDGPRSRMPRLGRTRERLPEDFREMANARRPLARVHGAPQMGEAARVVRDDAVDSGRLDVRELALQHAIRELGILEAERATEPAADRGLRHLDDLDARDLAQERSRILMDAQDVRGLAGIVIRRA